MTRSVRAELPFDLNLPIQGAISRKLFAMVRGPLQRLLSLEAMNRIYRQAAGAESPVQFARRVLKFLRIEYRVSPEDLARLPRSGPVVVVANHPFGGIEGIMLGAMLQEVRPDVKIMANFLLHRIPELRDMFIFVDPFGTEQSTAANLKGMRQTIAWLKKDGMLAVFPAGEVAHLQLKRREVLDPAWSPSIARIIRRTNATVVPVFFDGSNSALFHMIGLVHPRLRTAMLPHELMNKKGKTFDIRIGRPIPPEKLREIEDDNKLMAYLRQRTYLLGCRTDSTPPRFVSTTPASNPSRFDPVVAPGPAEVLHEEVLRLSDQVLVDSHEYAVIQASTPQIPATLREIGRLRELTFRATGEGTGKSIDLDEFDDHYVHLFVWNKEKREVVGAYRLGQTDTILKTRGPRGLYLTTLFDMKPELLRQFNPALEMGRSFVRAEYQRSFAPLLLLWKGIAHYVCRNPRYKILIGPVSISSSYNTISRQLMVAFLQLHTAMPDLARLVKPRTPFNMHEIHGRHLETTEFLHNIDEVSAAVAEIEGDDKGVPILLKQYLKLGGRILGFNLDPSFADALDGLLYVDLTQTDRRVLDRYMGKENTERFLAFHASSAG